MLLSTVSLGNTLCKPIPNLENAFNFDDYRTCHHQLYLCPHLNNSPFLGPTCVKRTIQLNKFCTQLQIISDVIDANPAFLTIKDYRGKIAIIRVYYAADGGKNYYILTPRKCLIETVLDPRRLNTELKKRYKRFNFYTENDGEPKVEFYNDDSISVRVPIKVTNTCRACKVILKANIQYNFSPNGSLVHTAVNL